MATTTLRAYLDELQGLLAQEALEEVIGHCRHILQYFPKNIDVYRILGRALLEKRQYQEAGDVFQRVLSAVPDDLVAHVGMSTVSTELSQLPNAIWHLERAYEQEPNSEALQSELKRLYERRDGTAPNNIPLTRGNLARMYVKGKLYDQAIAELQGALQQTPDRVDLLLLLAESLWNHQRKVEAGDAALRVLDVLPNALGANRILASLWLQSGRPSDAEAFVSTLEQLDPFLAWATVHTDGKELPRNAFQLPHLDWNARAAAALVSDTPDWVSQIDGTYDSPTPVDLGGGLSDWTADTVTQLPGEVPIPDWMADVTSADNMPTLSDNAPEAGEFVPDWFKDSESSAPTPTELPVETPTWADFPLPAADDIPSGFTDILQKSGSQPVEQGPDTGSLPGAAPDWFNDTTPESTAQPMDTPDPMSWLNTGPLTPPEGMEPVAAADATPDPMSWLNTGPLTPPDDLPPVSAIDAAPDPMSWLNTGPLTPPEDMPAEPASSEMSWMDMPTDEHFEVAAGTDDSVSAIPDWLSAAQPQTAAPEPMVDNADNNMDWLSSASADQPVADEPVANESIPDWLSAAQPAFTESPESADLEEQPGLDWLNEPAAADANWSGATQPSTDEPVSSDRPTGLTGLFDNVPETVASTTRDADYLPSMESRESTGTTGDLSKSITGLTGLFGDELAGQQENLDWLADIPPIPEEEPPKPTTKGLLEAAKATGTQPVVPSAAPEPTPGAEQGDLDWLSGLDTSPQSTESAFEAPIDSSGGNDWLSGLDTSPQSAEPTLEAPLDLGGDWLSGLEPSPQSAEPALEAPLDLGGDWLSGLEPSPQSAEPALDAPVDSGAGEDWLGGLDTTSQSTEPALEAPVASGDADDWLSSLRLDGEAEPDAMQTAIPTGDVDLDNSLDWLSSPTPSENDTNSAAEPEFSLDSLFSESLPAADDELPSLDMFGEEVSIADESLTPVDSNPVPDAEPAMPRPSSPTQPLDIAALDESEYDWMSNEPTGMTGLFSDMPAASPEAAAGDSDVFSKLGLTPKTDSLDGRPTAPTGMTNLFSMPDSDEQNPLDWLNGDELTEAGVPESTPHQEPEVVKTDPMAWLRPYQETGEVASTPTDQSDVLDWMGEPAADSASSTGDNWLEALGEVEAPPIPTPKPVVDTPADVPAMNSAADWLSQPSAEVSSSDDWMSAFEPSDTGLSEPAPDPEAEDETPDWITSIVGSSAAPEQGSDSPDWMLGMESAPEPEPVRDESTGWMMPGQARTPDSAAPIGETGMLQSGETPDWMAAFNDEPITPAVSADSGEPDWLNAAVADDREAETVDSGDEEVAESADLPDWLSQAAPVVEAESTSTSNQRPLDDLFSDDFIAESDAATVPTLDSKTEDSADAFDLDALFDAAEEQPVNQVAQPANIVDTNAGVKTQPIQAKRPAMTFKFDRPPVWLRKKQETLQPAVGPSQPASKPREDLPDWLQNPVDFEDESSGDDLPDWLKE